MADAIPKSSRWYLPSRRWLRFSLRAFLLFVVVLSLPLGWLGKRFADRRAQESLIEEVYEVGGVVGISIHDHDISTSLDRVDIAAGYTPNYYYTRVEIGPGVAGKDARRVVRRALQHLRALDTLTIRNAEIGIADLERIGDLKNLEVVELDGAPISDEVMLGISKLSKLEHLNLALTDVSNSGLSRLQKLPSLQMLDVRGTLITRQGIARFRAAHPGVGVFWAPRLDDAATAAARALRRRGWEIMPVAEMDNNAEALVGVCPPARDELPPADEIALVQHFSRISVSLDPLRHKPAQAACFAGLEQLEEFRCHGIDDAMLAKLSSSKKLRSLSVWESSITAEGLAHLSLLPSIDMLDLFRVPASRVEMEKIAAIKTLRRLSLNIETVERDALVPLATLDHLTELTVLCTNFDAQRLQDGKGFKALRNFTLSIGNFDGSTVEAVCQLPKLTHLDVIGTTISDDELLKLAGIESLRELTAWGCPNITPSGIARLRPAVVFN